jgi:CDP-glucose 4,6-dehydratase
MKSGQVSADFWNKKKVFLTGHTGFKGGWLSLWLSKMGAEVTGYALNPNTTQNLFQILDIKSVIHSSTIDDIRNVIALERAILMAKPDIFIHMAAQPLVRYSYSNPIETFSTNIMGTVNVLEAIRKSESIRATVIITSDKCYENLGLSRGYREDDHMGGFDPYSCSKGCVELIVSTYRNSFNFNLNSIATARAGNVIGGGDWSEDRLIVDAIKSFERNTPLMVRNPLSIRPWQHVLEPLSGYLLLAQALYENGNAFSSGWNFGPHESDARTVQEVIKVLSREWGQDLKWQVEEGKMVHEANLLKLDISKAKSELHWGPRWDLETAIKKTVEWHQAYTNGIDITPFSNEQINQYLS